MENLHENQIPETDGTQAPLSDNVSSQETDQSPQSGKDTLTDFEERILDKLSKTIDECITAAHGAMADVEKRIREAEERGFKRAIEMARQNPAEMGVLPTVPNFLADVRPDIWED